MIKNILLIFSVTVAVQCQIYAAPYQRSCSCGMPAMPAFVPANQPCGNPVPLPIPIYESLPAAKSKLIAAPYEISMPAVIQKGPILAAPYEIPLPMPVPLPVPLPAPGSQIVANPPCGCYEAPLPQFEVPLPIGMPLPNPFLPAASPVSGIAPYNPMMPPACPCSRCQYLKKIPIPPPCI